MVAKQSCLEEANLPNDTLLQKERRGSLCKEAARVQHAVRPCALGAASHELLQTCHTVT